MADRFYSLALFLASAIGEKRFFRLVNYFKSAQKAWQAKLSDFKKLGLGEKIYNKFAKFRDSFDISAYAKNLASENTNFVVYNEPFYPANLLKIADKPPVLFYKGEIENIDWSRSIAVVGTRRITSYGQAVTEKIVRTLVENNFVIISGLALGVDALSHKTALNSNGKTVAVLGSGVDICYPRENEFLYKQIIQTKNLVLANFPPKTSPSTGTFPARNRIISGLALGVLVTEAGQDSGSLITAGWAEKEGRPVFAVPGSIDSIQSKGALKLLKGGATLVESASDILAYFKLQAKTSKRPAENILFSEEEKKIMELLAAEAMPVDNLTRKSGIKIGELNILLSGLEIKGAIKNQEGGLFEKIQK